MFSAEERIGRLNKGLLILVIGILLYVVITPLIPMYYFWTDSYTGQAEKLSRAIHGPAPTDNSPQPNHLTAPGLLTDPFIQEGEDATSAIGNTVWHPQISSTPDKGGNTVFIGSRFTYGHPRGAFYFLDKLQLNDEINITWSNKQYLYKVVSSEILGSGASSKFATSQQPTVTLYTTTPLWHPTQRLAVTAQLVTKP